MGGSRNPEIARAKNAKSEINFTFAAFATLREIIRNGHD